MNEPAQKKTNFTLNCVPWSGTVLSIAIIAIRAFQSGAAPIESWSIGSWVLMLSPIFLQFIIWIVVTIIWFIWIVIAEEFSK